MTGSRRELLAVILMTIVGAALVLLSTSRTWAHAVVSVLGSLGAPRRLDLSGRTVAPLVAALGLVALAAVIALLATRGRWRIVIGCLIAVAGALIVGATASITASDVRHGSALRDADSQAALRDARISVELRSWRHVAAAGGLLIAGAGLVAAARGRSWAAMGRKYDAPTAASTATPAAVSTATPTPTSTATAASMESRAVPPPPTVDETPVASPVAPSTPSVSEPSTDSVESDVDDLEMWDRLERGDDPTA
jgi:uncharacterized membrane protein (TIGR02234 family)